jgi:hypothetical protein
MVLGEASSWLMGMFGGADTGFCEHPIKETANKSDMNILIYTSLTSCGVAHNVHGNHAVPRIL